jgi:MFS transporter, DHA1 family, inner membrane transport protein
MFESLRGLGSEAAQTRPSEFPFVLSAGERRSYTANTIIRDPAWRRKGADGALRISPGDAARLGVSDHAQVRLHTRRGSVVVPIEIFDRMRNGHLSLPNGHGADDSASQASKASSSGVAPNELTSSCDGDAFAGTPGTSLFRPELRCCHDQQSHQIEVLVIERLHMSRTMTKGEISAREVTAALSIGSAALLIMGVQPILLGEMLDARQITLEGVGLVAMAELVALGLGVLLGDLAKPLTRLRSVTVIASLSVLALDALTLKATGDVGFALIRGAAGLAEGVLLWATTAIIVRLPDPARVAGIFFVVQTLAQALICLVLARTVIPAYGWQGAIVVLAALMLLPAILAVGLPRTLRSLAAPAHTGFRWSPRTAAPLLAVFLQMSALGSLWAYLEPLGKSAGFDAKGIQTLIAAAFAFQVTGGGVASALVHRLFPRPTLIAGSAALGASALAMSPGLGASPLVFASLSAAFSFMWVFILPFQTAMSFGADPSGRVASLVPAAQLFGFAFGPLVASVLVEGENAAAVPMVSAAFAAAAGLVLVAALASQRSATAVA